MTRAPLTIVLSGPGGVGKGTVARRLVEVDPTLWLSRSWTTRSRRIDDGPSAYHFSTRGEFEAHRDAGGFLEWNEFHGNLYGTPLPDAPPHRDVLLEIDVNGGRQVRERDPDALLIFIDAPSVDEQRERLVRRGDSVDVAEARIREGERERRDAQKLGYVFVINDDIDRAVAEIRRRIAARRRHGGGTTSRARSC